MFAGSIDGWKVSVGLGGERGLSWEDGGVVIARRPIQCCSPQLGQTFGPTGNRTLN